ncbi:MAG: ABC transporter ATP-binding protein [Chloroflexota bacterium]|nr:MAG: ABC transporter ATP-binding protein [Chloroflexota bacterium]
MTSEFVARRSYNTDHRSPLRFILSHVRRNPVFGVTMVIGAFSNAALASLVPYYVGQAFDAVNESADLQVVTNMVIAIVLSQLLRSSLQLMRNFSAEIFAQRIERDVRDELYASLLGKSMTYHDFQPVGEIMARVTNDVRELNLMMNPGMNLLIGSGMFLLLPVFSSPLLIHPALVLTPAIFIILYVIAQYHYIRRLNPASQAVRKTFGDMNAELAETLDGLQVVKGSAQEEAEIRGFNKLADSVRDAVVHQGRIEARYLPVLLLGLANAGGFVHAVILYQQGAIEVGQIVAYTGQLALFGFPVFSSIRSFAQLTLGYASARRILEVITAETDLDQNVSGYEADIKGAITFENVAFGYVEGQRVLHDVSFTIEPGQTVAIVGQTGSGKTSITKLINRIYDVDSGSVKVDGVDVRDWKLESLRSQISIIEQDIFLFSRSIRENIRFGRPDATDEEVEEAARKAQAHDFIMSFPDGYDTVIGQRGVTLSGGQRQRLAIARAFVTNPPILILDDSTSAIDSATEDRIQQAIWAAAKGRTTILITHRLSQIRWADHIIVLKQGRVVAQGRHEDLLETSEAYRRIFARYEGAQSTQESQAVKAATDTRGH